MRFPWRRIVGSVCLAVLAGCASSPAPPKDGPPPLKVSFRASQIPNQGMVVNLNNPSDAESIKVLVVFVQGKDEKEERSYRLDRVVKGLDSISVGWAELRGWKLTPGDKLRIRCEGFTGDLACEVPG